MLTQARLKELLKYDPETGEFTRIKRTGRSKPVGEVIKTPHNAGYVTAAIDGSEYLQHRLVWLYVHGCFPPDDIDHRDGDRANNRLANLRLADRSQNLQNKAMQSNNTSGHIGVSWRSNRSRWVAQIRALGVNRYLGSYKTPEEARAAYLRAKETAHPFQPTPRELIS